MDAAERRDLELRMINFQEKEFKKVVSLFKECSVLREYQRKQLITLLIASTLNKGSAREVAELIVEKNSEWTPPSSNPSTDTNRGDPI